MDDAQKAVTRRAGIVGLGTLASRVLGLVRESVIVAFFPKEAVDAFQTAFMIPNTFRRLTAEGSFSISVVSVFSKIWDKEDLDASRSFVRAVLGFALIFLTALTGFGVWGAEMLTWAASWGSGGHVEKFEMATSLTRLMFPYVLLVSLTALAMGLLNSTGRFFAPAFAPVLLNVSIIGSAVGLGGSMPRLGIHPIFALAMGVLIGGVAQVVLQIPWLRSIKLLVRPSLNFRHPGLIQVLKLTGPMVFGTAAYQVGIFFSYSLAWTLPHGSVMYINSANRLVELPLAVLVMAISTAALPSLAALRGQGKTDEMKATYSHSLRLALFVATPAMIALIVLAEPVVAILYQRGLFTHAETLKTAAGLRWLALGICSVALVRQTVPVFYALERVWVPVIMALVYITVHVSTGLLLKGPFLHEGLCMASSIGAAVQGFGLVILLRARIGRLGIGRTAIAWLRILLTSLPMAAAAYGTSLLGNWNEGGNSAGNIGVLILTVLVGVVVYSLTAYLLKVPEFKDLLYSFKQKRS